MRWAVLTSGPESPSDLRIPFRALVKRIRRHPEFGPTFEYAVTREVGQLHGMRHLNVLWRGAYIRQAWLDDTWWELARARHVHVERVQSAGGVAVYVAKYVTKDPTAARGVWYSAGWLGAGDIGMVARACRDRRAWSVWRGFLGGDAVAIDQVEDVKAALLEGIHRWRITGIATTT